MMGDYVDRKVVFDAIQDTLIDTECQEFVQRLVDEKLDTIPSADVRPVVHGKWEYEEYGCYCSICHEYALEDEYGPHKTSYCPECGADMMEE